MSRKVMVCAEEWEPITLNKIAQTSATTTHLGPGHCINSLLRWTGYWRVFGLDGGGRPPLQESWNDVRARPPTPISSTAPAVPTHAHGSPAARCCRRDAPVDMAR